MVNTQSVPTGISAHVACTHAMQPHACSPTDCTSTHTHTHPEAHRAQVCAHTHPHKFPEVHGAQVCTHPHTPKGTRNTGVHIHNPSYSEAHRAWVHTQLSPHTHSSYPEAHIAHVCTHTEFNPTYSCHSPRAHPAWTRVHCTSVCSHTQTRSSTSPSHLPSPVWSPKHSSSGLGVPQEGEQHCPPSLAARPCWVEVPALTGSSPPQTMPTACCWRCLWLRCC